MDYEIEYPIRINKYLAHRGYSTRIGADALIKAGKVTINSRPAVLGDKVIETDIVEVNDIKRNYRYFAYNKPRGMVTHSPQKGEKDILDSIPVKGVFPIGRLDKDSKGLIILTDDARITDRLLNPEYEHEKEYHVTVREPMPSFFKRRMEAGIDLEKYITKPSVVEILNPSKFSIALTEGKKHQIRRMCDALSMAIDELVRVRIMNVHLDTLPDGAIRRVEGEELAELLKSLGL